ncbi:MAG: ABC transporter permease subunit [Deltaproteobacteria bacterium]|nr:ABC transporter permease subunit [Deltaproteobacteria bacterium]
MATTRQVYGRVLLVGAILMCSAAVARPRGVLVASKTFTEAVILGEALTQLLNSNGVPAQHVPSLGDSPILWKALQSGEIDAYGDYTGTVIRETLGMTGELHNFDLPAALAKYGIGVSRPLGFSNVYILGMRADKARQLGIRKISDLRFHPQLKLGFGNDFVERHDGWPLIKRRYHLTHKHPKTMEHQITYRALASGDIDVTNLYSTDAEIKAYDIVALEDDLRIFPSYEAIYLYRLDTAAKYPGLMRSLSHISGNISEKDMIAMNAAVREGTESEATAATRFLRSIGIAIKPKKHLGRINESLKGVAEDTLRHLTLVFIPLALNCLVALPLGVLAARYPKFGVYALGFVGVAQTIPSLALLVFLIPFLGVGYPPALAALFIYGTLPIMKNTYEGIVGIAPSLRESAEALGLSSWRRLWDVELPLASPLMIAGVKVAAILNVGTATLGAIIGAGGYGEPILEGIRHDDMAVILTGAVPAALLAVVIQVAFGWLEKFVIPRGLRQAAT